MRPERRFHPPYGVGVYATAAVISFGSTVPITLLISKLWANDDIPLLIDILLPLGSILCVVSIFLSMLLCLRWQLQGILPRARGGVMLIQPRKSFLACVTPALVGAWIFLVGGIAGMVQLLNTSASRITVVALGLSLAGLACWTYVGYRLTRVRFAADRSGLRWDNPLWPSSNTLTWEQIAAIELRGWGPVGMKMVAIEKGGRSRSVRFQDPSIPVSREAYLTLLDEIGGLRVAEKTAHHP